ncbi:MAG: outer membrane lipoprotein-sorting protein [Candidatus Korobacteraceae bacterium]
MAVLLACCTAAPLLSWCQARPLTLGEIVSRMTRAQAESRDRDLAYSITREYQLSAQGAASPSSQVVAEINFVPPSAKDYSIVKSEGSDRGKSIVRKVLEHESQMASHSEEHAVTARNYDFALLGRETVNGRDCYVLQLSPRREAVDLIRGKAWVDANNFALRRMEGSPVKSPSMWIKNLTVTIDYENVNGIWVATATKAVADLRFVGKHMLTSRELEVRTATVSARNRPPGRVPSRSNAQRAASRAATWIAPE